MKTYHNYPTSLNFIVSENLDPWSATLGTFVVAIDLNHGKIHASVRTYSSKGQYERECAGFSTTSGLDK